MRPRPMLPLLIPLLTLAFAGCLGGGGGAAPPEAAQEGPSKLTAADVPDRTSAADADEVAPPPAVETREESLRVFVAADVLGTPSWANDLEQSNVFQEPVERGATAVQVELAWDPQVLLHERLTLHVRGTTEVAATGPSPIAVLLSADQFDPTGDLWAAAGAGDNAPVPAGAAVDQDVTLYVTVFRGTTPPEGWLYSRDGPLEGF